MKKHTRSLSWRQALAIAVGNGLEFYDFVTYAFFATQIGRTFFPSSTPGLSLLSSLATFGAGFLTRRGKSAGWQGLQGHRAYS